MICKSLIPHALWVSILFTTGANAGGTESGSNAFLGSSAGGSNTTGINNTFVGHLAGRDNTEGEVNTFVGDGAGSNNIDGDNNVSIGVSAGASSSNASNNVFVGTFAGFSTSGSNNVFLGFSAGQNESSSNKLYIDNSSSSDPLIYGDFDNDIVGINGTLGVGTESPGEAVDVVQDGGARFQLSSFSSTATDAAQYIQRRARGTQAAPASVQSGDNIGLFSFRGMRPNGLFSGSKAAITVQATQNWQNSQNGTSIKFGTTQNGTSTLSTVMEITHDKKVKINGTTLNVPDYVFEEEYDLMPLDELEAFIQEHKHLPNVASAEQVKREGVDIGGSQMALLEKIEELTLYTLRQEARIEAQQAEISELQRIEDQMIELRILVNRLVANDQLTAVN